MSVRDSIDEYDFAARHLGTLRHFDHILLENALVWGNGSSYDCPASNKSGAGSNSWNQPSCAGKVTWAGNESIIAETILPLFERMFAPLGEPLHINTNGASGASWFHYSEANIAGNIPYPHGIKFVIVTFPVLFGTGNVTAVREWCVQWGWPLVCESPRTVPLDFRLRMHRRALALLACSSTPIDLNLFECDVSAVSNAATGALGPNSASDSGFMGGDQKFAVDGNDRLLDPIVLSKIGAGENMTVSGTDATTLRKFQALWESVNSTREATGPSNQPPPSSNFSSWWAQLKSEMPRAVHLQSLRAGDCADVDKCLGINGDGRCVCNVFK